MIDRDSLSKRSAFLRDVKGKEEAERIQTAVIAKFVRTVWYMINTALEEKYQRLEGETWYGLFRLSSVFNLRALKNHCYELKRHAFRGLQKRLGSRRAIMSESADRSFRLSWVYPTNSLALVVCS